MVSIFRGSSPSGSIASSLDGLAARLRDFDESHSLPPPSPRPSSRYDQYNNFQSILIQFKILLFFFSLMWFLKGCQEVHLAVQLHLKKEKDQPRLLLLEEDFFRVLC